MTTGTMVQSSIRMWGLIDDGNITGVFSTRNAARLAKLGGYHGSIHRVFVTVA